MLVVMSCHVISQNIEGHDMEPASQKEIKPARAEDIVFVKPSHSDAHEAEAV